MSEVQQVRLPVQRHHAYGSDKNRRRNKKKGPLGSSGKISVIGTIARKGNVICQVLVSTERAQFTNFVDRTVSGKVSLVGTDEHHGYKTLSGTVCRMRLSRSVR